MTRLRTTASVRVSLSHRRGQHLHLLVHGVSSDLPAGLLIARPVLWAET